MNRFISWVGSTASLVIHTIFFIGVFALRLVNVPLDYILLVLTTAVSLEAIYLAIFIQTTVNQHTASLQDVGEEIEELGEEVEDISEDIEEISDDIDLLQEEDVVEEQEDQETRASLENIEGALQRILIDIETLKKSKQNDSV